jgi:pyrroloquinoline quinone (PQQ) biosynthesis protein C
LPTSRRTVPFLSRPVVRNDDWVLLVDRAEMALSAGSNAATMRLIARPLNLGPATGCYSVAAAEELVEKQYETCLEYIFGHPVWQRFRDGTGADAVRAYLLESRHYLAAAPFRMASGVTDALRPSTLVKLQAHHVVEEAGHDTYFENALAALGSPRSLVRLARPSPVTVEWIHLMRTVAAYGPLTAGICSGLLESTAGDTEAVAGWHEMLVEHGLLDRDAVDAIFEHVQTDLGLGHGSNWRKAIKAAHVVPAQDLADALNAVTLVAEMIVRWVEALETALSDDLVRAMPTLESRGDEQVLGRESDGLPVWPAEVYHSFTHGPASGSPAVRSALAIAYGFEERVRPAPGAGTDIGRVVDAATHFVRRTAYTEDESTTLESAEKLVHGWMTAIDGHELWQELATRPTYSLVYGWMVENYHYVAGIWQHAGGAIASCPDPLLRSELVQHLIEEFNHGDMFLRGISKGRGDRYGSLHPRDARPLPTTVAFIGTLRGLGQRDWKAYVLALGFLQMSLAPSEHGVAERHEDFYRGMFQALPEAEPLVAAMRRHDAEDTRLGHGDDTRAMLEHLVERHEVGAESVRAAAVIPQLAWSFLDGIRQHYRHGDASVMQRMGWHVAG